MIRASRQDGSYPRPQLLRQNWTDLDGEWHFGYDDEDRGRSDHWEAQASLPQRIRVPYAPESTASGIGDNGFHPIVWYMRELPLDDEDRTDRRVILHFGAVDHEADVWVDGTHVGSHQGGQTAFHFDITHALVDTGPHRVTVRAFDPYDSQRPRGKQDWREQPHFIWYRRTTGIWKSVWLETVPDVYVDSVSWTTRIDEGSVRGVIGLSRAPVEGTTEVEIELWRERDRLARVAVSVTDPRVAVELAVPEWRNAQERERVFWSPETPVLLDVVVRVRVWGEVVDDVGSYVGLRSASVDRGSFLLNGQPYFVRSVLEQGYWEEGQLTAPSVEALRREVELIKALGFNAVRLHQKVEDARLLYWADRLGLLVWAETAAAYEYTAAAAAHLIKEWIEIVEQQRNHPCIVTWVPINESWGVQDLAVRPEQRAFVVAISNLTRALDPTRPVVSNDGWEHLDSDILTIHDYSSDAAVLQSRYSSVDRVRVTVDGIGPQRRRIILDDRMRDRLDELPVMISEFGGIAHSQTGTWGYTVVSDATAFREQLGQLLTAVQQSATVGFCYTQLTDTLQESNGLLTANREPKLPMEVLRSLIVGEESPTVIAELHITDSIGDAARETQAAL